MRKIVFLALAALSLAACSKGGADVVGSYKLAIPMRMSLENGTDTTFYFTLADKDTTWLVIPDRIDHMTSEFGCLEIRVFSKLDAKNPKNSKEVADDNNAHFKCSFVTEGKNEIKKFEQNHYWGLYVEDYLPVQATLTYTNGSASKTVSTVIVPVIRPVLKAFNKDGNALDKEGTDHYLAFNHADNTTYRLIPLFNPSPYYSFNLLSADTYRTLNFSDPANLDFTTTNRPVCEIIERSGSNANGQQYYYEISRGTGKGHATVVFTYDDGRIHASRKIEIYNTDYGLIDNQSGNEITSALSIPVGSYKDLRLKDFSKGQIVTSGYFDYSGSFFVAGSNDEPGYWWGTTNKVNNAWRVTVYKSGQGDAGRLLTEDPVGKTEDLWFTWADSEPDLQERTVPDSRYKQKVKLTAIAAN